MAPNRCEIDVMSADSISSTLLVGLSGEEEGGGGRKDYFQILW